MKTLRSLDLPPLPSCGALALLSILALPTGALAEAKDKPHAADTTAAQTLFDQGRALMKQGRPREACPKFQESQRLEPGLGTQYNLADCLEQLGKLASAHVLFTQVADAARATGQEQRERVARARAEAVEPRLTKLAILVPEGSDGELKIERDGIPVTEADWGSAVPVDPGVHLVRASSPGLGQWATKIEIASDGAVHQVTIPDTERSFFTPLSNKLGMAAAGVAVIGLGAATYFTVYALDQKQDAEAAGCQGTQCPTQEGVDLRHSASNAGDLATVSLGVGVVGLAAAAALFWVVPNLGNEKTPESASVEWTPVAAPGFGALLVGGSF